LLASHGLGRFTRVECGFDEVIGFDANWVFQDMLSRLRISVPPLRSRMTNRCLFVPYGILGGLKDAFQDVP
jgi:hypothetical protein